MPPFVVRWLVVALVLVAALAAGFAKGVSYQQGRDEVAHAEQVEAAELLAQQQRAASNQILTDRETRIHELENQAPAVRTVLRDICLRDAGAGGAPLVSAAPGAVQPPGAAASDRSALEQDLTADIQQCRALIVDYNALRGWVLANGGDKP